MKSGKKEQALRAAREKPLIPFGPNDPTNDEVQPMVPVVPKEKAVKTKRKARKPVHNGHGNGDGKSKREQIIELARRKHGCTLIEVLSLTEKIDGKRWPSVSMPQVAASQGVKLRRVKQKGEATRYFVTA